MCGGSFTRLEGFHSRTGVEVEVEEEWRITQKDAYFNLKEWKTTLQRVLFHSFAFREWRHAIEDGFELLQKCNERVSDY